VRTAVYHGAGEVRLEQRPVPVPGPGEVLVEMRACGICGSDLMEWYLSSRVPLVLGHEPAGVRPTSCRCRTR
jgi:L-iditol 2-dehydrogenase